MAIAIADPEDDQNASDQFVQDLAQMSDSEVRDDFSALLQHALSIEESEV